MTDLESLPTLAARVTYYRHFRGMTIPQLAEATELSPDTITAIERGLIRRPSQPTLLALSRGLRVEALWLVYGGS